MHQMLVFICILPNSPAREPHGALFVVYSSGVRGRIAEPDLAKQTIQELKHMKRVQQGFTLIELMIVIAIVGILAAVALPAYQDYTVRAKLSEGLARAGEAKTAVTEYYSSTGTFPTATNYTAVFTSVGAGKVSTVTWLDTGSQAIVVTFNTAAGSNGISELGGSSRLDIVASASNGIVSWRCGGGGTTVPGKYRPGSCK